MPCADCMCRLLTSLHLLPAAERALETLNYAPLNGKPMRLMWSHRDPASRRSGVGNIFIKVSSVSRPCHAPSAKHQACGLSCVHTVVDGVDVLRRACIGRIVRVADLLN